MIYLKKNKPLRKYSKINPEEKSNTNILTFLANIYILDIIKI